MKLRYTYGMFFTSKNTFFNSANEFIYFTPPQTQTKTMSVCFQIGVPIANQDFICLLWGISGGTSCLNDDGVIGPCNLVTERVRRGLSIHNS